MASEQIKRDENRIPVIAGVKDDGSKDIVMLKVDPTTGYLLADLIII